MKHVTPPSKPLPKPRTLAEFVAKYGKPKTLAEAKANAAK
jgi:hypothetical protein